MSSLNKVSISGSNAGRSLAGSRQSSYRSGINNTVNNINSLQASARSRMQLGSRRMSRSSQRNVDMILKRILGRKKSINKAISDMKSVHSKAIGYDSLQNIMKKFKLPLSKDESLMLFENAKVLDDAASKVDSNTWSSSVNATATGKANTIEITESLSISLIGKLDSLIEIFENLQRDPTAYSHQANNDETLLKKVISLFNKLKLPFDEKVIRKIFSRNHSAKKRNDGIGNSSRSINTNSSNKLMAIMQTKRNDTNNQKQRSLDDIFTKLKRSLRLHWKELHRSVEVLAVSGKFEYIPLDLVTRLFDKHYLGVGASEINSLIAVRKNYLTKQGIKSKETTHNGFGTDLFSKLVSACIDRQWANVMKTLDALMNEMDNSYDNNMNLELEIANKLQTYNVYLREEDVAYILSSPDIAAPLSMSINLDDFNDDKGRTNLKRRNNNRLPPRGKPGSNGRRMVQRRGFNNTFNRGKRRNNRNNSFATQQKVKELWQEIQKEYRNMPGQSDGCLNEKQFVEVITKLGLKIRPQKLKIMFRQFDTKGTGQIFFDDFLSKFLSLGGGGKPNNNNNNASRVNTADSNSKIMLQRKSTDIGLLNRSQSIGSLNRPDDVPRLNLGLARIQSETDLDFLEEWGDNNDIMALCD